MEQHRTFTATIKIIGINPYIGVPQQVVKELGGGRKAVVLVKVVGIPPMKTSKRVKLENNADRLKAIGRLARGNWFRTTLVPLRSGVTRLYLDQWMRGIAGVGVGDRVRATLKPDRGSRELPIPVALRDALASSRRREILT